MHSVAQEKGGEAVKITLSRQDTVERQGDCMAIVRLLAILEACQKKPDIVAMDEWIINDKQEMGIVIQMWIDYLTQIANNMISGNLWYVHPDKHEKYKSVFDFPFEKDWAKMLREKRSKALTHEAQKNHHAVALSKLGAAKGGRAKAAMMTLEQRTEMGRKMAEIRWNKAKEKGKKL